LFEATRLTRRGRAGDLSNPQLAKRSLIKSL
jgi:hypothetical protein